MRGIICGVTTPAALALGGDLKTRAREVRTKRASEPGNFYE